MDVVFHCGRSSSEFGTHGTWWRGHCCWLNTLGIRPFRSSIMFWSRCKTTFPPRCRVMHSDIFETILAFRYYSIMMRDYSETQCFLWQLDDLLYLMVASVTSSLNYFHIVTCEAGVIGKCEGSEAIAYLDGIIAAMRNMRSVFPNPTARYVRQLLTDESQRLLIM